VGSIGTTGTLYIASNTASGAGGFRFGNDTSTTLILPCTNTGANKDGNVSLGYSNNRFKDLWLSGGVYLGGTGSANYLDDYEEGTWSLPNGAVGGITFSVSSTSGVTYTKIGRQITVNGVINYGANTSDNNPTYLGSLPFTPASGGTFIGKCRTTSNISGCCVRITASQTFIQLMKDSGGSFDYVTRAESASETFEFTVTYQI